MGIPAKRPKVAVFKFSSCDGCQLSLLNLGEQLLTLDQRVEIAYFLEASRRTQPGPYDIALVEGSVSTSEEAERIQRIRAEAKVVVALGTCAAVGGIQALRNFGDAQAMARMVYPHPEYLDFLAQSTPLHEHIAVDYAIPGCPVNGHWVVQALAALLLGAPPRLPDTPLCLECKRQGIPCVMVAQGIPCLGPLTRAGCGALCPSVGRGCFGCFGGYAQGNPQAWAHTAQRRERHPGEARHLARHLAGYDPVFRQAVEALNEAPSPSLGASPPSQEVSHEA